ncbi:MAG: hypothetical protein JWM11_5234 [Planctomycetaceae bacterium]|nr:hypothetical protein [Planctomycetaceae bacterium]
MSLPKIRFLVLAVSVGLLFIATAFADVPFDRFHSSAPLDGEVFVLVNTCSGRCLAIQNGLKCRGANVVQGALPASAGAGERWKIVKTDNYFKLINENSGLVLAVPEASRLQGQQIVQWDDSGTEDQQWEFVKIGHHYSVKSRVSGLVLGVSESRKDDAAPVVQWQLAEIPDQVWLIQWVPGLGKR